MPARVVSIMTCLLYLAVASAQGDSVQVTKNFRFADGVYHAFSDFQGNTPTLPWDSVYVVSATNPETFLTQVEYIRRKNGGEVNLDSIWGIVIDGIPYMRLPKGATSKKLTAFAGIRLRGIICYFSYEDEEEYFVEIQAYNPVTGVPFRKGKVKNKETVIREYMLHFQSGKIAEFTQENLVAWVSDDERLAQAIADLPESELYEKLFKGLLIYVDRYPVYTLKR